MTVSATAIINPHGTLVGFVLVQGWPARRVSQSQVGPVFDSYSSWPRGICTAPQLGVRLHRGESPGTATRSFYSPLLQPLPLLRCFCYIRPCRLDVPGSFSSSSSSSFPRLSPAIHKTITSHAFVSQRGGGVSSSTGLFFSSHGAQRKDKPSSHMANAI